MASYDSDVTQFGLPVEGQDAAREFLIGHIEKLSDGNYSEAANDLKFSDEPYFNEWLSDSCPGLIQRIKPLFWKPFVPMNDSLACHYWM